MPPRGLFDFNASMVLGLGVAFVGYALGARGVSGWVFAIIGAAVVFSAIMLVAIYAAAVERREQLAVAAKVARRALIRHQ